MTRTTLYSESRFFLEHRGHVGCSFSNMLFRLEHLCNVYLSVYHASKKLQMSSAFYNDREGQVPIQ